MWAAKRSRKAVYTFIFSFLAVARIRGVGWCSLWGRNQIESLVFDVQQEPGPSASP